MQCDFIDTPNGRIVICSHRRSRPKCACGNRATKQCDYPNARGKGTCDRNLCNRCAISVGPDRDYCRTHPLTGGLRHQTELGL